MQCVPLGDQAITVRRLELTDAASLAAFAETLRVTAPAYVRDIVPAFDSISVEYDAAGTDPSIDLVASLTDWLRSTRERFADRHVDSAPRTHRLPVSYGGVAGPDLVDLAARAGMTPDDLIALHAGATYTVLAVGFMPGFAYLGGLPAVLQWPRRKTPRVRVPAGSVAVGGPYAGIYPFESPGGWHLLGTTDVTLFDPTNGATFRVGDRVIFEPRATETA